MIELVCDNSTALLEEYPIETSPKGTVLICPGGGYSFLSPREAAPIANAFTKAGYRAFVLYYNVEKEVLGDLPLHQLSKAVSYIKKQTKEKIFVCGFSAGAHLAASLGILWNSKERFEEGCDLNAHKPDAMILAYPVITSGEKAHRGSMVRLAGEEEKKQGYYSLEHFVDEDTVQAFIWGTAADDTVPVENSLLLLEKLVECQVPVEYHLFPYGVHGLSLATKEVEEPEKGRFYDEHVARWMKLCIHWLDEIATSE